MFTTGPSPLAVRSEQLKWLDREFTDRKFRSSNLTSTSRLPSPKLGQPGSIQALALPSGGLRSAVALFRYLAAMPPESCTRAGILPGCPSLNSGNREAEAGPSVNSRSYHLDHLAPHYSRTHNTLSNVNSLITTFRISNALHTSANATALTEAWLTKSEHGFQMSETCLSNRVRRCFKPTYCWNS
ncbi:LOW QUALITY PROTEIN: hypothetical protein T265_14056 [Opisthorchis viverrini]|uniref:Uncharacterized protein n=1 Tax=Opisthorchis viverrini TaxID=6198 RepID=A0A074ZS57_OPIVI|nr:LOW QUALITY PROTEIN: hypothetical protein T265_14056 [Opisthorchis viverrini]KER26165.1 LOW QUALITY PROTEIN: hypothetical protein T265_14056 [Opisthorchis viverrini]